jgi:hypothetical protein
MTLEEMVGGVDEQPRQLQSLQAEVLKPLWTSFSLLLLLTSASERGAFPLAFTFLFGVLIGLVSSSGSSCSSMMGSRITEVEASKFGQADKKTDGQALGR